jgi:4-aminobutyrate aminotransferase/(S)-3-amino-2-methylpropionate transaminase
VVRGRLLALQAELPAIGEVRGEGAMLALELVADRDTKAPDAGLATEVLRRSHAAGLVVLRAGLHDNVVRLLMPLNIGEADLDRGLSILETALREASRPDSADQHQTRGDNA